MSEVGATAGPFPSRDGPFAPAPVPFDAKCARHHERAAELVCARCGSFACEACVFSRESVRPLCIECGPREAIPWEQRKTLGAWKAFWATTRMAARTPTDFFSRPSSEPGAMMPTAYGICAYTAGQVLANLQLAVLLTLSGLALSAILAATDSRQAPIGLVLVVYGLCVGLAIVPMTLLQAPIQALFGILGGGALAHGVLVLFKQRTATIEQTIRAVSYAQAGWGYNWVPIIGPFITWPWVIVLEVIAVRETHKSSTFAAIVAANAFRVLMIGLFLGVYAVVLAMVFATDGFARPR